MNDQRIGKVFRMETRDAEFWAVPFQQNKNGGYSVWLVSWYAGDRTPSKAVRKAGFRNRDFEDALCFKPVSELPPKVAERFHAVGA